MCVFVSGLKMQPLQPLLAPPQERLVAASQRFQPREQGVRRCDRVDDGRVVHAACRKHHVGQDHARAPLRGSGRHRLVCVRAWSVYELDRNQR